MNQKGKVATVKANVILEWDHKSPDHTSVQIPRDNGSTVFCLDWTRLASTSGHGTTFFKKTTKTDKLEQVQGRIRREATYQPDIVCSC